MTADARPGDDDRRLRGGERWIGKCLARQLASKAEDRQAISRKADPITVWADGLLVVGTRAPCGVFAIASCCPFCGQPHVHNGKPHVVVGKRQATCGPGYVVHLGTVEGEVSA